MGAAMHRDTPAPEADSEVDKLSTAARCVAVAVSMVEAASTVEADSMAADADKRQSC
jgi:hypothetical protein